MSELGSARIRDLMYGTWIAQSVYAAARLDLADHVSAGARGIDELARRCGADPDTLYRLMRALSSAGVFEELTDRDFAMTPAAEALRTGEDDSVKDLVLFYGKEVHRSYGRIDESIRTGRPALDAEFGKPIWDYLEQLPEEDNTFRRGMGATSWRAQLPLPRTYDFGGVKHLVDLGGGEGTMLAAILHEHPEMTGTLVELPGGMDRTMRHFVDAGVRDRCTLIEGSGFDEVPSGDGYFLSCVFHVLDDQASLRVLARIREAITSDGRLVILERIISPPNEGGLAKTLDLSMLLTNGGRERTEHEWHELLENGGFKLTRVVPMPYFIGGTELVAIEAMPTPR